MEPESTMPSTLKKLMLAFLIFLFVILFVYLCFLVAGTKKKIASINEEYGFELSEENPIDEKLFNDPEYLELQKKKSFLEARIKMAESDSICLSVNLKDSLAMLEINGAAVFSSKISRIKLSSIFNKASEYAIAGMLSSPLEVNESFSTIEKEPIMIKIAPKDTIEANVPDIMPDTSSFEPVNFILVMKNGVRLYVYQEEEEKSSDKKSMFKFDLDDRMRFTRAAIDSIIKLKAPDSEPFIKIRLPKDDAKIIYRAIATKGLVSIYR